MFTGENKKFDRRALLLYDGIHYDPLVIMNEASTVLQTTFPISDETVVLEATDIAREAHKVRV